LSSGEQFFSKGKLSFFKFYLINGAGLWQRPAKKSEKLKNLIPFKEKKN